MVSAMMHGYGWVLYLLLLLFLLQVKVHIKIHNWFDKE